ncbi:MAG: nitric oxide reductase transcriptional regulator NorR [Aquabacterium sp.]
MTMIEPMVLADLAVNLPRAVRLQRLTAHLKMAFDCDAVALLQLDGEVLRPLAVDGLSRDALGRTFQLSQHPRLAAILVERGVVDFEHASHLPDPYDGLIDDMAGAPLPVHDCMGASVWIDGHRWGVLTLDALRPGTFGTAGHQMLAELMPLICAAVRTTMLEQEVQTLRQARTTDHAGSASPSGTTAEAVIIGRSTALQHVLHELEVVAQSDLPVLLMGETGVGKDLFAQRVHAHSARSHRPMVQVNCAALPESLAESELFGHVRGAFSGATTDRAGRIEAAKGGTLFLDEIGELPLGIQAKLLRTLQNGEVQRLGADKPFKVDVRVIAATNRGLRDAVAQGGFRADLYHRLSVYPVHIPPLREREDDVLLLAGHFIEINRARLGLRSLRLDASAEAALLRYPWPGNVRELEHVISRAALKLLSRGIDRKDIATISADLLDLFPLQGASLLPLPDGGAPATTHHVDAMGQPAAVQPPGQTPISLRDQVDMLQRQRIHEALAQTDQNWAMAARLLDLDASNLHKLARRLGIKSGHKSNARPPG